ncbi:MAG: glycosyltransferase family 39 protein, partial [Chloroflexota bacterium]
VCANCLHAKTDTALFVDGDSGHFIPYDGISITRKLHTEDELFPFRGIVLAWHLARLVSIGLSVLTIIAIYLIVQAIYPQQPYFALAVAGFAAFVPRFVINSAVVNDDNLVIPLIAFSLYGLIRVIQGHTQRRSLLIVGSLIGLAVVAKYHSIVLLAEVTLTFVLLVTYRRESWRVWGRRWLWVMLGFLLTAGVWFIYLFYQFNQIAELGVIQGLLAPLGDPTTTNVTDLWSMIISWAWVTPVFRTFWIVAGSILVFAPDYVYQTLTILTIIALIGLFFTLYRASRLRQSWSLEICLLVTHLLLYVGIVFGRYQVFVAQGVDPPPYSTQGRHLYPALVSIAFLYVLGWRGVLLSIRSLFTPLPSVQRMDRALALTTAISFCVFSFVAFFFFVRPLFYPFLPITRQQPRLANLNNQQPSVVFQENMEFVGYSFDAGSPRTHRLPIELNWRTNNPLSRDYVMQLCLNDNQGYQVLCHWGYPADGLYPTRIWEPGYFVRDERVLPLPHCLEEDDYELTLSIWPLDNGAAISTLDPQISLPTAHSLGKIPISLPTPTHDSPELLLCTNEQCFSSGVVKVSQMRQSLALVREYDKDNTPLPNDSVHFRLQDELSDVGHRWASFQDSGIYACRDGERFRMETFLIDEGVLPGTYEVVINDQPYNPLSLHVSTRPRKFALSAAPQVLQDVVYEDQVKLVGYDIDLAPRWPQDPLTVTTYWQGQEKMTRNYNVAIHLLDNSQVSQAFSDQTLGELYPNMLWAPGEYVRETQLINQPDTPLSPGLYQVELRLYDHTDSLFRSLSAVDRSRNVPLEKNVFMGQIRILDPARATAPTFPLNVHLDQTIRLHGFDVDDPFVPQSGTISFRLYWQAAQALSSDYTVFTQLLDASGKLWAQQDNQPQQGRFPTSNWQIDDMVVDRYEIALSEDVPPGIYQLYVGMYDWRTGERLPTMDQASGESFLHNAIPLNQITVTTLAGS